MPVNKKLRYNTTHEYPEVILNGPKTSLKAWMYCTLMKHTKMLFLIQIFFSAYQYKCKGIIKNDVNQWLCHFKSCKSCLLAAFDIILL